MFRQAFLREVAWASKKDPSRAHNRRPAAVPESAPFRSFCFQRPRRARAICRARVRGSAGKNTRTPRSSIAPSKCSVPCRPLASFRSVDRFKGLIQGLVIAEVELAHPEQQIELPSWVGEEITFNPRYSNSNAARSPIRDRAARRRSTWIGAGSAASRWCGRKSWRPDRIDTLYGFRGGDGS